MTSHNALLGGWLFLLVLVSCAEKESTKTTSIYCGESFCLRGVAENSVTKTSPVQDFNRYFLSLPIGQVEIYEGNSPDLRDLRREKVSDLPALDAWALSPTPQPAILVIVGRDWPETLVFSIDDGNDSAKQLVTLMQGLELRDRTP